MLHEYLIISFAALMILLSGAQLFITNRYLQFAGFLAGAAWAGYFTYLFLDFIGWVQTGFSLLMR